MKTTVQIKRLVNRNLNRLFETDLQLNGLLKKLENYLSKKSELASEYILDILDVNKKHS